MSGTANVRSLEAIRDFKASVIKFSDAVVAALDEIESEIMHFLDWLEHDRPNYWRNQVRQGFDSIAECRVAFERCKMNKVAGHEPSCIEERKALDRAKQRLQFCQEQVERVRRWSVYARHETDEFHGRIAQLKHAVEHEIPQTLNLLERTIGSLEAYLSVQTSGDIEVPPEDDHNEEKAEGPPTST